MTIRVLIPAPLRGDCDGARELKLAAATVRDALAQLAERHPSLYFSVCDETGAPRRHVNLFVNDDLIRSLNGLDSALSPGDALAIFPNVSGG